MKKLKVLSIGNSFSVDGMEYLYEIACNAGFEEIILGNLYIGGCSLKMHLEQINADASDYIYYKNTTGEWIAFEGKKIIDGLQDEDWDIINLQQVSHHSGQSDKYQPELNKLVAYVKQHKTNPKAKLAWHMTWAYQKDSPHGGFALYNNHQLTMYQQIVKCVKEHIATNKDFTYMIPSGTVIQNMRTTDLGDTLTRDGFHLSFDKGRFFASMCWFKALTNSSLENISFKPEGVNDTMLKQCKQAVEYACKEPFTVTDLGKDYL